jgi:hypothetical protein
MINPYTLYVLASQTAEQLSHVAPDGGIMIRGVKVHQLDKVKLCCHYGGNAVFYYILFSDNFGDTQDAI